MARIHSWLTPKCQVVPSPKGGLGVFAFHELDELELIAVFGGRIYTSQELAQQSPAHPELDAFAVTVHDGFSLGQFAPGDTPDDTEYLNHSCEPNAGIKGQIVVLARRVIHAGEEVCMDYETTQIDVTPFPCQCGAATCRGIIRGDAWESPEYQQRNHGWFSWYLEQRIAQRNRRN